MQESWFQRIVVDGLLVGTLAGVIASAVFVFFLSRMKPRLQFSKRISRSKDVDGRTRYEIKFINLIRRSVVEIQMQLEAIRLVPSPGGDYNHPTLISLKKSHLLEVGPAGDPHNRYDWRVITYDDLDDLALKNDYFRLTLLAKDSFSGYSRVYVERFECKHSPIVDGTFPIGLGLDVEFEPSPVAADDPRVEKEDAVLRVLRGEPVTQVARAAGTTCEILGKWVERFLAGGSANLRPIACDVCFNAIEDGEVAVFHYSGMLRGELRSHVHVCDSCRITHADIFRFVDLNRLTQETSHD